MVWGITAGSVAGVVGGPIAALLHVPSSVGLDSLDRVAGVAASLPLGSVDLRHLVSLAVAAFVVLRFPPRAQVAGVVLAAVVVVAPVLAPSTDGARQVGWGATVWVDGPVAVVDLDRGADPVAVIEMLRETRISAVGLVVVRSARPAMVPVVAAIRSRFPVGAVIGPPGSTIADVVVPSLGLRIRVRRLEVVVDTPGPPMRARVGWATGAEPETGTDASAPG
jgi:hypothetical protein